MDSASTINFDDDEDDDMDGELNRLDSVTAAIRESLDESHHAELVTSPLQFRRFLTSVSDDNACSISAPLTKCTSNPNSRSFGDNFDSIGLKTKESNSQQGIRTSVIYYVQNALRLVDANVASVIKNLNSLNQSKSSVYQELEIALAVAVLVMSFISVMLLI